MKDFKTLVAIYLLAEHRVIQAKNISGGIIVGEDYILRKHKSKMIVEKFKEGTQFTVDVDVKNNLNSVRVLELLNHVLPV